MYLILTLLHKPGDATPAISYQSVIFHYTVELVFRYHVPGEWGPRPPCYWQRFTAANPKQAKPGPE